MTESNSLKADLNLQPVKKKCGEFCAFIYEGEVFPGKITSFTKENVTISAMVKSLKSWKWPQKVDEMTYDWSDVLGVIAPPKLVNKRGCYLVPELAVLWD